MNTSAIIAAVVGLGIALAVLADDEPAVGKFLVATDDVQGSDFSRTVILLLHYDEFGAQGLVINRPMAAAVDELFPDSETLQEYQGSLYFGGPVGMSTMRALLLTENPPAEAVAIFGNVYHVPVDEKLADYPLDAANLRFYAGYAGWSPGQLEREIRFDSWTVMAAKEAAVFAEDAGPVWRSLRPPERIRAAMPVRPQPGPESVLSANRRGR